MLAAKRLFDATFAFSMLQIINLVNCLVPSNTLHYFHQKGSPHPRDPARRFILYFLFVLGKQYRFVKLNHKACFMVSGRKHHVDIMSTRSITAIVATSYDENTDSPVSASHGYCIIHKAFRSLKITIKCTVSNHISV
jgi:hypothetical protein